MLVSGVGRRWESIRRNGSSGGFAGAISKKFIEIGGKVCSCKFERGKFVFSITDTLEGIRRFAGSKYVKSNPEGCYKKVKEELRKGSRILFIGLPCQVAALKNYIDGKYDATLYTIDLICHGTPSPFLLDIFLNQYNLKLTELDDIKFRAKSAFRVMNGMKNVATNGTSDRYSIAFLNSLIYTENCYECYYAQKKRVSDITLGDSWGSLLNENDCKSGISLALCQTEKGHALIKGSNLHLESVDLEIVILNNHQLSYPSVKPDTYDVFFKICEKENFNKAVSKCCPKQCFRQDVKGLLSRIGLFKGGYLL